MLEVLSAPFYRNLDTTKSRWAWCATLLQDAKRTDRKRCFSFLSAAKRRHALKQEEFGSNNPSVGRSLSRQTILTSAYDKFACHSLNKVK